MGLLLACMISRADLLGEALLEERDALDASLPKAADGWGAGFYQAGEALHRKLPQPIDGQIEWGGVLDGVRAHVVIAHVREATVGDRRADNTQPFRMRQWLFAHIGEVAGYPALREQLVGSLPDFLRRNIRGQTDSELLFHVILSFLHDSGHLDSMDVSDAAVAAALRGAVTLVDRSAREVGAAPSNLALALTNGRQLYALRRGSPLCLVQRDSLAPRRSGSDPADAKHTAQQTVRYVVVASYRGQVPTGYRDVADGEVVCIDRDLNVTRHGL